MNTITVNGVDYAPVTDTTPTERRIVIAQRGWAFVGTWTQDGDEITLTNASVIRRWEIGRASCRERVSSPV